MCRFPCYSSVWPRVVPAATFLMFKWLRKSVFLHRDKQIVRTMSKASPEVHLSHSEELRSARCSAKRSQRTRRRFVPTKTTLRWLNVKEIDNEVLRCLVERLRLLQDVAKHAEHPNPGGERGFPTASASSHLAEDAVLGSPQAVTDDELKRLHTSQHMSKQHGRSHFFRHHFRHFSDSAGEPCGTDDDGIFKGLMVRLNATNAIASELRQLREAWDSLPPEMAVQAGMATSFQHTAAGHALKSGDLESITARRMELISAGDAFYQEQRLEDAVAAYTEGILCSFGCHSDDFCRRGRCFCELGRHSLCIADCRHALVLDPRNAWASFYMGMSFLRMNNGHEAISALRHAMTVDPSVPLFRTTLRRAERVTRQLPTSGARMCATAQRLRPSLKGLAQTYVGSCLGHDVVAGVPRVEDFDYSRPAAVLQAWHAKKMGAKDDRANSLPTLSDTEYEHYADQCRVRQPDPLAKTSLDAVVGADRTNPRLYFALTEDLPQLQHHSCDGGSPTSLLLDDIRDKAARAFSSFDSSQTSSDWLTVRSQMTLHKEADVARGVLNFDRKLAEFKAIDKNVM
jgi:hypothetical protein